MKKITLLTLFFTFSFLAFSQTEPEPKKTDAPVYNQTFEEAEELFQLNKPQEAIPLFEKIIDDETVDPRIWVYLGVAYYQTGDYEKSVEICVKGLSKPNTNHKVLAYNAGNSAYLMGNYARADACYAIAMKEDPAYAPPVLNRANAQLKQDNVADAKTNYELYLTLNPDTQQRANIELMIQKLEREIKLRESLKPELVVIDDFDDPYTQSGQGQGEPKLEKIDFEILSILKDESKEQDENSGEERVFGEEAPVISAAEEHKPAEATSDFGEKLYEENTAPVLPPEPKRTKSEEKVSAAESAAPELSPAEKKDIPEEKISDGDSVAPELKYSKQEKANSGERLSESDATAPEFGAKEENDTFAGEKVGKDATAPSVSDEKSKQGDTFDSLPELDEKVLDF